MSLELKKVTPVELRSLGLDEKWLQDQIRDDPSLLGLGELEIAGREHRQPAGGRIDFLMRDAEAETYYEVEVMLGPLDEAHIIRSIEYWDIERQRRPQFEHRAVIVAERITARFFNVLRLLNRSVPAIAVQLNAYRIDDSIVLHPVTVLDVFEEVAEGEGGEIEQVDRSYWEKKSAPASLAMVDKILSTLPAQGIQPRVTYNRYHIAVGTTGRNFCWLRPRKTPGNCHVEFRVTADLRDAVLASLQNVGIDATPWRSENIAFRITAKSLEEQSNLVIESLKRAEEASRL
jgi:hypothetical protein